MAYRLDFKCFDNNRNMWHKLVGSADQVGFFDYLFLVPLLFKIGLKKATNKKNMPVAIALVVLQFPFSIIKLGLYIAFSPVIFIGWLIDKAVSGHKIRHQITGDQVDLNKLMVKKPDAKPGSKPQLLSKVHTVYDFQASQYKLKIGSNDELIFEFRSKKKNPKGGYQWVNKDVAVVTKTQNNIKILRDMLAHHKFPGVNHIVGMNFSGAANSKIIEDWIDRTEQHFAKRHIQLEQDVLVNRVVRTTEQHETNFGDIPRDVRQMIFQMHVEGAAPEPTDSSSSARFFPSLAKHNREAALAQFKTDPNIATKWHSPNAG